MRLRLGSKTHLPLYTPRFVGAQLGTIIIAAIRLAVRTKRNNWRRPVPADRADAGDQPGAATPISDCSVGEQRRLAFHAGGW
jgi:hypothetical protein